MAAGRSSPLSRPMSMIGNDEAISSLLKLYEADTCSLASTAGVCWLLGFDAV
jgi:hypothetical protein